MMIRDAVNEIRLHPGRFVATLLAVAISVGFMAAIVVGVRTEENAVGQKGTLWLSKADVVVSGVEGEAAEITERIATVDGVDDVLALKTTQAPLSKGDRSEFYALYAVPAENFRWSGLLEGSWPSAPDEIALSKQSAEKLGARVGDVVTAGLGGGEADEEGTGEAEIKVVGLTDDPAPLFGGVGYFAPQMEAGQTAAMLVRTGTPDATIPRITAELGQDFGADLEVTTAEAFRASYLKELTGGFEIFRNMLLGFAGISLIVGMIIIANTFTILLTQRRRQIGLLRAVGASSGQVAGRLVIEAFLLGLVGSLLGVGIGYLVALGVSLYTGSLAWGLAFPAGELLLAVLAGVLATVVSVIGPSLRATRISPLEALQVVPTAAQSKRLGIVRGVFCVLFALGGGALLLPAFQDQKAGLLWAIAGCGLLSLAVLLAAPFYVSFLIRVVGGLFSATGPTVRLAVANSVRNPRRASATAVALMLAVGLVVTLQVGVSTMRSSAVQAINERYPVDILVRAEKPLEPALINELRAAGAVSAVAEVSSRTIAVTDRQGEPFEFIVRNVNPAREQLGLSDKLAASDGTIVVGRWATDFLPETVEVPGAGSLKVVGSDSVESSEAAVSSATFEQITGTAEMREVWLKLVDRTSMSGLNEVMKILEGREGLQTGGSAVLAGVMEQVINVVLIVLTGLLGVAVVIALVGVGNTLGLSVLERQRESALLRALGMQRSSLRKMLLVEALLLGAVGVGVGILAGVFFSWVGVTTSLNMFPEDQKIDAVFSVDLLYTGGLILVCILAAALASVLPGRRAANATPTEALAAD
ncbi:ABC transporter permease [Arachnia propionica]|uniref:ABC transporter permease n=1 Tax=Arachnia propionica TaxID=1750 RepID=A0A3P1T7L6_9ACTN|nr:ABC transporter permease [Arachnia propionica]RRD05487.1 ABC transporter permease [Arachnia propionica]